MLQLRRHASWTWSPSLEVLCYLRHRESQGHGNQSRVLSSSRLRVLKQKPRKNKAPKKKKKSEKISIEDKRSSSTILSAKEKKRSRGKVARAVQFASQVQRGGEGTTARKATRVRRGREERRRRRRLPITGHKPVIR
jgi:hypothetical protein